MTIHLLRRPLWKRVLRALLVLYRLDRFGISVAPRRFRLQAAFWATVQTLR